MAGAVRIHTAEYGAGDPPLVLVHGFTGCSVDFDDVVGPLARDRKVITMDHRGHGRSDHAAEYSFDLLLSDLEGVIGGQRVHLLGHSMGGIIAMRFALAHPEQLASLILMDTAAEPARRIPAQYLEDVVALGRAQGMAAVLAAAMAANPPSTETARSRTTTKISGLDVEAMDQLGRELHSYPSMLADLKALDTPTTVISGRNDYLLEPCETIAATIPGAVLEIIEDAEHSPQEENPGAWLLAVAGHFARVGA